MDLRTHASVRSIGEADFRRLARDAPPFLGFDWLDALEQTGCVRPERGWLPMHLTLHDEDRLVAIVPAYAKGNSEGEFVFDHGWARFAEDRLRIEYYPKILCAVPFTPATGARVLVDDERERERATAIIAQGLRQLAVESGASSAHVLFSTKNEADALERGGMLRRLGVQFHWQNAGYACFDDFLGRFSAKRRHQIRRERNEAEKQGIEIESRAGNELSPDLVDCVYELYLSTVEKFYWGRQYLNRAFFHEVCSRMGQHVHVVLARERGKTKPIAGAFNLIDSRALYGRYWGAHREVPFLHFHVCYYRGIEDAIQKKLAWFEPGAGGEHKLPRGFVPTLTHSSHVLVDPRLEAAVRDFTIRERDAIAEHIADAEREVFRR
jgi:predicted N-acyltransferase